MIYREKFVDVFIITQLKPPLWHCGDVPRFINEYELVTGHVLEAHSVFYIILLTHPLSF